MAFDHDAKLFGVLANGYHLNTQLQALLGGRPLDSLGQQEALAFSQELSRVFKVSMSMLNSNTVTRVKTAPVIRTGDSSGLIIHQAAKDKRARSDSGEVVTPVKKSREDGVTRKEITASPHKDGYEWRKYGQKNIQNCNYVRYYFRCSRDRRCEAKKKVQQQDEDGGSRGQQLSPPMFEVTYVNDHTCHVLRAIANNGDAGARMAASTPRTTNHRYGVVDTARDKDGVMFDEASSSFPRIVGGGDAQEDEAIVSCLATVISGGGAAPSPSPPPLWPPAAEALRSGPTAYVPAPMQAAASGGHWASVGVAEDGGAMMVDTDTDTDTNFCWDPSSLCAVGEGDQVMTDHRDVHVDVAWLADTVWPRHTSTGAWWR